jgi:hypothetical protein
MPGPQENFPSARNPFGVEAAAPILEVLEAIGGLGSLVLVVAMIISVILRFYRSRGEERLQLKWFAYAATLGFMAILLGGDRPFMEHSSGRSDPSASPSRPASRSSSIASTT